MRKIGNRKVHLFVAFTLPFSSPTCPNNDLMEPKKEKAPGSVITQRHESDNPRKKKQHQVQHKANHSPRPPRKED
jgi:hypothetical protein